MKITADAVKQLRERTGAGMMECKKALVEIGGDLDAAAELMRKQGLAKADKKAARLAAEGIDRRRALGRRHERRARRSQLRDRFRRARAGLPRVRRRPSASWRWRSAGSMSRRCSRSRRATGETLDERRRALIAKIGENITVRRVALRRRRRLRSAPTSTARASERWWHCRAATRRWRATSPCTSRP